MLAHRVVRCDAVTSPELGHLVEPKYNLFRDKSSVLQEQIDAFVVGYCPLNAENEIIEGRGRRSLICGTADQALGIKEAVIAQAFTHKTLTEYKAQGFRFTANEIVGGPTKDLKQWQSFCDIMRAED